MTAVRSRRPQTKFEKEQAKLRAELGTSLETLEAMDADGLRRSIVGSETNIAESEKAKKEDADLMEAKGTVSQLVGPYKDAVKHQRAKIKYALQLLESRGDKAAKGAKG